MATLNMKRTAWAGLALALWCGARADANVTGVQAHKVGQGVEILVQGEDLAKPKILRLNGNRSYMLEFQAGLKGPKKHLQVHQGGVEYVTVGWYSSDPPVVRVHLWLKPDQNPQLSQSTGGWLVSVNTPAPKGPATDAQAFPNKVPPIKTTPAVAAPAQSGVSYSRKVHKADPPAPAYDPATKLVTLDGSNTEIVQVLKMLALQSGANIITGPEVAGKVNVNLRLVTLKEALDYVTTLASVRYAKVGQTYIVTSNARFAEAMRQIAEKLEETGETRVVQLVSGEGVQLKAAAFKALPQYTAMGSYDIILPTDDISVGSSSGTGIGQQEQGTTGTKTEATTAAGGPGGRGLAAGPSSPGGAGGNEKTTDTGSSGSEGKTTQTNANISGVSVKTSADRAKTGAKDPYLVVVGSPARVQEVVDFVKGLDNEVARAANVGPNKDIATKVIPIYCAQVPKIRTSLQALVDRDPRKAAFHIEDSRIAKGESESTSAGLPDIDLLFLTGPGDALEDLATFAKALDQGICEAEGVPYASTPEETKRIYEVVDLQSVEPIEAAKELSQRVRGLQASMLPAPVDPLILGSKDAPVSGLKQPPTGDHKLTSANKQETGGQSGAAPAGGAPPQGGTAAPGTTGAAGTSSGGTSAESTSKQEFDYDYDKTIGAEPMKLLLYGTRAQIAAGKDLLKMLDLPPQQVAMELRVMELTHSEAENLGLDWNILTGGTLKSLEVNQSLGGSAGSAGNVNTSINLPQGDSLGALATLDHITDRNKLIARPNIIVNDGRPAEMFVGQHIIYIQSIQQTQNIGTTVTTGTLDVGVTMRVTARVGQGDMLTLDLRPTLSILTNWIPVPGGGQLPQTSERTAVTIATIKSGQTIALGGMIQDQDQKTFSGIPFLRDLPIIGQLFSRTNKTKSRSEVVFFLTAKIVNEKDRVAAAHPLAHDKDVMPGEPVIKQPVKRLTTGTGRSRD